MNDITIVAVPFVVAVLFFLLWVARTRQQAAAKRAVRKERDAREASNTAAPQAALSVDQPNISHCQTVK